MKNEKKTTWVFVFQKYGKFWSILWGHFINPKPLISEECIVNVFRCYFPKIVFIYLFIFCLEKFYVEHRDHSIQPIDWRGMGRTFQSDLWIRLWFLENGYFSILGCGVSTKKLILSLGGLLCVFKTTYSDGSDTRNSGF